MKGYKFRVEFVVWRREDVYKARQDLENFLLESGTEEGFNTKTPIFMGEQEDPLQKLRG